MKVEGRSCQQHPSTLVGRGNSIPLFYAGVAATRRRRTSHSPPMNYVSSCKWRQKLSFSVKHNTTTGSLHRISKDRCGIYYNIRVTAFLKKCYCVELNACISGVFPKLGKATISFVMSVYLSWRRTSQ